MKYDFYFAFVYLKHMSQFWWKSDSVIEPVFRANSTFELTFTAINEQFVTLLRDALTIL